MPYLALDDNFPDNPKVAGLSDRAFRLHVVALCYCSAQLTDGLVRNKAKLWANIGGNIRSFSRLTDELCLAGLWDIVDGGYVIHDYLEWNASAAQIKEKRRKDRLRKRAAGFADSARNPHGTQNEFHADSAGSAPRETPKGVSLSRELAKSARAREPKTSDYTRAENMTRNGGWQYEPVDFLAELDKFALDPGQRHDLEQLRVSLANGAETEDLDW